MLPILTGNVGLPGTSTGQQEGNTAVPAVYLPVGTNPVKATIPCFLWTDAIVRGREMDDVHDGLRGVKTLGHDIKMIVNSGGNTLICDVRDYTDLRILGATRDDAAGECFDKTARVLGLPYPGGKPIDDLSKTGDDRKYKLPIGHVDGCPYDMSFSGLKTAVINLAHTAEQKGEPLDKASLAASFCRAMSESLVPRTMAAVRELGYDKLAVAGGVAANSRIRGDFQAACDAAGIRLFVPPLKLCGDNAAMIGCQAYYEYLRGARAGSELNAWANMEISEVPFYGHA